MMNNAHFQYLLKKAKDYLTMKTEMVNHQSVVKDVVSSVERSWIYYLMLMMASLIALLGLLTNSVSVVIGAMLISPLMAPIISSGLALTIGDLPLARRAFRTISISVALTIVVSALVTVMSPLKEPTAEILARVRPNIYDLFVAIFSGISGAVALCTKRNYLITATGVAVATAVIPPLSVVGYGLGTGQAMLALGGFLLFFTNFVAIVITSDLVFFAMGFRTSHVETAQYSQRTRLLIVATVLSLISIPLVYTLVVDLKRLNAKKQIERVLKEFLDKEHVSRMTGYDYQANDSEAIVAASVNTVDFINKDREKKIEESLRSRLETPVKLQLEQVIVASERLPLPTGKIAFKADSAKESSRFETSAEIAGKVGGMVAKTEQALAAAFAPFPVIDTRLAFARGTKPLLVTTTLQRDYPVSDDERLILERQMEESLGVPIKLSVTVTHLLPPLQFSKNGALTPESIKALSIIKQLPEGPSRYLFYLEPYTKDHARNSVVLRNHLNKELGVPVRSLSLGKSTAKAASSRGLVLRITRNMRVE